MESYGKELIIDMHDCDISKFNRKDLGIYIDKLIELADMEKQDRHWWDYVDEDLTQEEIDEIPNHLYGTSVIQFITTSNITIHTVDKMKRIYINLFSCKDFDGIDILTYTEDFFAGDVVNIKTVIRK